MAVPDPRYLIAVDLDNTIVSEIFSLSAHSARALIDAQEAGHIVMIATARSSAMSLPYYRAMALRSPLSILNGAGLYHPDDPSFPACSAALAAETVAALSSAIRCAGIENAWIENDGQVDMIGVETPDSPYFSEVFRHSDVRVHKELPAEPACRLLVCADSREQIEAVYDAVKARKDTQFRLFARGENAYFLSCSAPRADKWFTVERVARHYGIDREHIVAFGDEENDRAMIKGAGRGFIMCNGNKALREDAPALGARISQSPCAEGGVGKALRSLGII